MILRKHKAKTDAKPIDARNSFRLRFLKKGAAEIDYIIAIGFFIFMLVLSLNFMTGYLSSAKDSARIEILRSESSTLMNKILTDLGTDAYRVFILVNNTQGDLINELVSFNLSSNIDLNSTMLYEINYQNNSIIYNRISYSRSNEIYTFAINISAGTTKNFIAYFDDDSNFTDRSVSVSGIDNLTSGYEKVYPAEKIFLIQYKKILSFINKTYEEVKGNSSVEGDFRIRLLDSSNSTVFDFGQTPPVRGNIVAVQKYVVYKNSTDIKNGRLIIQLW